MATFIWPPEVQWPPPAHILLNYDVVAPGGAVLSLRRASEMEEIRMQPFLAMITPLSSGGQPDQGLPGQPNYPDQGLPGQPPGIWPSPGYPAHPIAPGRPPGIWGGPPTYPDQGLPGWQPRPSHPIAPGGRPPGIWGGPPSYPDQGLPPIYHPGHPDHGLPSQPCVWPSPGHPDQGLPPSGLQPPAGGQPVPPDQIAMPDPPEDLADDVLISIYKPGQGWTTTSYDVPGTGRSTK